MKTKILLGFAFFFSSYSSAQADIMMKLRIRFTEVFLITQIKRLLQVVILFLGQSSNSLEEQNTKFWKNVTLYPVPVKNILTIEWNQEINPLIESISLYEHSRLSQIFIQKMPLL